MVSALAISLLLIGSHLGVSEGLLEIYVRHHDETRAFEVPNDARVGVLKRVVADEIKLTFFSLVFGGTTLDSDQPLADIGIGAESVVEVHEELTEEWEQYIKLNVVDALSRYPGQKAAVYVGSLDETVVRSDTTYFTTDPVSRWKCGLVEKDALDLYTVHKYHEGPETKSWSDLESFGWHVRYERRAE